MCDLIREALSVNPYRPKLIEADDSSPASPTAACRSTNGSAYSPTSPEPLTQRVEPISQTEGIWLTDEVLFNFQRCRRRAFLDLYGNAIERDPPSDYLLKLRQDSLKHQLEVLAGEPVHRVQYASRDWEAGAAATLELMQQGVDRITHGVLLVKQANGVNLVSCPDILVKHPGYSYFGDWIYVPNEIKLGKRPKLDYQITAAFHAYVLAIVQGAWTETSWLILRQRGAYAVDLVDLLPRMRSILDDCTQTLLDQQEPELFIAHNRCDLCHWFSHCYGLAKGDRHLSLLPGVTPSRYIHLQELKITTVEALANTPPKKLEDLPGFGAQVARKMIRQAQSTLENRPFARPPEPHEPPQLLTTTELPTAPVELYFDIEAAPEQNLVYLHGVLVVDRNSRTETFHPLLADHPDAEGAVWQQFIDLVWQYPTAPIYHFCPYEVQTVKRLAELYGTPTDRIDPLMHRFVDLHERVTRVATLPVESYALKNIARWIGFDWRDQEANGAQSIYWYAQWLETGDRSFLNAILRYNEDDCRATFHVKDWLVSFLASL